MDIRNVFPRALGVAALSLVIGCGGGGELGPATITEANAQMLAGQGMGAVDTLVSSSEMVDMFSSVISDPAAQTVPCDTGFADAMINDAVPQGVLSTGDSVSLNFRACYFGDSLPLTMNGTVSFQVLEATGTAPGPRTVVMAAQFRSLSVSALGVSLTLNGGFTVDVSTEDGITFDTIVSGTSLTAYATGGGQAFSGSVEDFRLERVYNTDTGDFLVDLTATVGSSQMGGKVTYETLVPFTGTDPDYPSAGSLLATGAEGATITLNALDSVNVQLLIDFPGDPTPDVTINTTWDVLDQG